MKSIKFIIVSCLVLLFASCQSDDSPGETAIFAVPKVKSLAAIRSSVSVTGAMETDSEGKIYVAKNYLFYIAKEQGVHVFDNQNPASPHNIAFLNIEGVHDIAVKDNFLYADNYMDLLVFDISDMEHITLVRTVENAITFYPAFPDTAEYYDYTVYPDQGEMITGFTLETRARPEGQELVMSEGALASFDAANGTVGTGGSYAKFQINENALYTVDNYQLNVFNISSPADTFFDKAVYMMTWFGGGQLETLFKQGDYLFAGATNGMHVIDATDEFNPYFLSTFSHATACDPVVVNGTKAYITVRGGTSCGAFEDQVNVVDIADITNPTSLSTYPLAQPYGLGYRNNVLYVCTGTNGLKVFDATNASGLVLQNSYPGTVTDVIPLDTQLITVGDNKVIQYTYGDNFTLNQISVVNF